MHLTDHDLRQLDRDALSQLEEEALRRLAERLLADLKEARDRLNQDSRNRSRPPGSDSVYRQPSGATERDVPTERAPGDPPTTIADQPREAVEVSDDGAALAKAPPGAATPAARRPGRQPGAPGFGRSQKLTVSTLCSIIGRSDARPVTSPSQPSRWVKPTGATTKSKCGWPIRTLQAGGCG